MPHKDKEKAREFHRKWRAEHREQVKEINTRSRDKVRAEVLTYYGNGKLACLLCGFSDVRALTIDHLDGNGADHRRVIGRGSALCSYLRKHNYPEGYQTLCMNCQFVKAKEFGEFTRGTGGCNA